MYRNIEKTVYKVNDFLSWQRNGSLRLSPSFQRRSVWPVAAKSFLIDTVVRGLPIPIIFLREQTNLDLDTLEPYREVVDGQQRLRTLISFIEPEILETFDQERESFTVKKAHNPEIAGKSFRQIDSKIRSQILNYSFSVHVLPSDVDDREVLQIFARINSTGLKLNKQELRNAAYFGDFKSLMYRLSYEQLTRWRTWKIFTENDIARMLEVEETSDIVRVMLEGIQGKSQAALDNLYKKFEDDFPESKIVTYRFRTVMDKIDEHLGTKISVTAFTRKTLFHTLFSFYYDLMFGLKTTMEKRSPKQLSRDVANAVLKASDRIQHEQVGEELLTVLRGATGNLGNRRERLAFLKQVLDSDTSK